jgi:hypothetical protein
VPATSPMSTACHVPATSPMSTAPMAVSEGRNNREATDTDRHSQSDPIPKSRIRVKPLERQQSLHKKPFTPCAESHIAIAALWYYTGKPSVKSVPPSNTKNRRID